MGCLVATLGLGTLQATLLLGWEGGPGGSHLYVATLVECQPVQRMLYFFVPCFWGGVLLVMVSEKTGTTWGNLQLSLRFSI